MIRGARATVRHGARPKRRQQQRASMTKDQASSQIVARLFAVHDDIDRRLRAMSGRLPALRPDDAKQAPTDDASCNPLVDQPQPLPDMVRDLLGQDSPIMERQREAIARLGVRRCRLVRTPGDYYEWSLEKRKKFLKAPSVSCLCKSMVMVNKKAPLDGTDPSMSPYYLVIFQYERRFDNDKLIEHLRSTAAPPMPAKKRYNFRVAPEDDSFRLSGFIHNAVSPLGFAHMEIPFVLDRRIVDTVDFFWLGGGEPDVKLAIGVDEFIRVFKPVVASVTSSE